MKPGRFGDERVVGAPKGARRSTGSADGARSAARARRRRAPRRGGSSRTGRSTCRRRRNRPEDVGEPGAGRRAAGLPTDEPGLGPDGAAAGPPRSARRCRPPPKSDEAAVGRMRGPPSEDRRRGPSACTRRGVGRGGGEPRAHPPAPRRAGPAGADEAAPQAAAARADRPAGSAAADAAPVARPRRRPAGRRRFRARNVVDDPGRLRPRPDRRRPGLRRAGRAPPRRLGAAPRRPPEGMVLDDGPEGASRATFDRPERTGVRRRLVGPGAPVRTAFVGSPNAGAPGRAPRPAPGPLAAARPRGDRSAAPAPEPPAGPAPPLTGPAPAKGSQRDADTNAGKRLPRR
jgi:putative transposase